MLLSTECRMQANISLISCKNNFSVFASEKDRKPEKNWFLFLELSE